MVEYSMRMTRPLLLLQTYLQRSVIPKALMLLITLYLS